MSRISLKQSMKVEEVRKSIKAYMDWNQGSDNHDLNTLIFQKNKELAAFYNDFVTQYVLNDIEDLRRIVKEDKLNEELFEAVYANDADLINSLSHKGASFEVLNKDGKTPLQVAEEEGCVDAIYALGGTLK